MLAGRPAPPPEETFQLKVATVGKSRRKKS
jgi:hypothetical protein